MQTTNSINRSTQSASLPDTRIASPIRLHRAATLAVALAGIWAGQTQSAVITSGDVDPADPSTWHNNTILTAGKIADGSVSVSAGSSVILGSIQADLGNASGITGTLTVEDPGSLWQGFGAAVINAGRKAGSTGIINVSNGGTVSSSAMRLGWANRATGYLNVTNGGRLTDVHGSLGEAIGATGVAVVDGSGSQLQGGMIVGNAGSGLLKISNGGTVVTNAGEIGRLNTASGRVLLDGKNSSWTIGDAGLQVGIGIDGGGGAGHLSVTGGATLSVDGAIQGSDIGVIAGSQGTVTVNGAGSTWSNAHDLEVGKAGTARLIVNDGGTVTATSLSINAASVLTSDVGTASSILLGNGAGVLSNNGTIRLTARAGIANGTYTPIAAGTWTGTGTVQALGGVYDPSTHAITVATAATGTAGVAATIDLSTSQRLLITDAETGKTVGASFQATTTPADLSLTATHMTGTTLSALQGLLDPGSAILSAWDFSTTGYTTGDPVYLSLGVGGGQDLLDLAVWHFNGSSWDKYLSSDLAYSHGYASFTVTGFSGYAVSGVPAPVPVPAAVILFGSGLVGLAGRARRTRPSRHHQ